MLFFVCLFWVVVVVGLFSLCSVRPYRKKQEGYNKSIDFVYYCMPPFFVYKCRTSRAFCLLVFGCYCGSVVHFVCFWLLLWVCFLLLFFVCLLFLKDLKQKVYIYIRLMNMYTLNDK